MIGTKQMQSPSCTLVRRDIVVMYVRSLLSNFTSISSSVSCVLVVASGEHVTVLFLFTAFVC